MDKIQEIIDELRDEIKIFEFNGEHAERAKLCLMKLEQELSKKDANVLESLSGKVETIYKNNKIQEIINKLNNFTVQGIKENPHDVYDLLSRLDQERSKPKDADVLDIKFIAEQVHQNAKDHGWWEEKRTIPELLCLVHSEVSEALEAYRKNDEDNLREELADIVIRVFDMSEGLGFDIKEEVMEKHRINISRPYKHGNKKI